jgi:uncharacterized protein YjiS (DUF1127 family)
MIVPAESSVIYIDTQSSAKAVPSRPALLDRLQTWLRRRADARVLRSLDAHIACDIGIDPMCGRAPEGSGWIRGRFGVSGLTPLPMNDPSLAGNERARPAGDA